jgi:Ca2+-binding RTX toxin-like protein
LFGGEGSDVLDGGAGDDRLIGGERGVPRRNRRGCDNDSLTGAAGDDTLDGGRGRGRDLIDPGADVNDVTADPDRDTIVEDVGQIRLTRLAVEVRERRVRQIERGDAGLAAAGAKHEY